MTYLLTFPNRAEAVGWTDAKTSNFLSYALIMFTVGRFVGLAFLTVIPAELLVGICECKCIIILPPSIAAYADDLCKRDRVHHVHDTHNLHDVFGGKGRHGLFDDHSVSPLSSCLK